MESGTLNDISKDLSAFVGTHFVYTYDKVINMPPGQLPDDFFDGK